MISLAERPIPANIDAEQALIGCVLYDNDAFARIDGVTPDCFHEPYHGRIWAQIAARMAKNILADPISIVDALKGDSAFEAMGGMQYLCDLEDHAPPAAKAGEYAAVLKDARLRRELLRLSGEMDKAAHDSEATGHQHLEAAEHALFALAEHGGETGGIVSLSDALDSTLDLIAKAFKNNGAVSGVPTGLIDLDAKLGGLHPSGLVIVAGRPSMGKTALALNIALNAAKAGARVVFFSLEMSKEELSGRLLADLTGISTDRQRKGQITAADYGSLKDAADELRRLPLDIDETGGIAISKLVTRARRWKRRQGLDLVVVDYIQLVTTGEKGMNRVQEVSLITQALKAMAKDLAVPVMALSQLSREVEKRDDKKPMLSDLRESGSIEQDADVVAFVYREAYYLERTEPKADTHEHDVWTDKMSQVQGLAEVIIAKQRHGPIGTVRLSWDGAVTRFGNLAREGDYAAVRVPYGDR
jgi:replicative DNA helicase